jgi:serine/threonine-protein kinase
MPAKVTLKVNKGQLVEGQVFGFEERTTCIIGRDGDCNLHVPDDNKYRSISRLHCLLDINPPDICIRDMGSLFGTFVNGTKIGQRTSEEQRGKAIFPEHDLRDGDELRLSDPAKGNTVNFRVEIYVPAVCAECSIEIPEEHKARAERAAGVYQCAACHQKAEAARRKEPVRKKARVCIQCGRDVSQEVGENRHGDYLCATCQADPFRVLKHLLELARSGQKELLAIQGYQILKELGKGGMGAVSLARHEKTGEQVALKVMLHDPEVAVQPLSKEDFLLETENTRALQHPNVVHFRDAGCSRGTFFFTMEYCDGGSVDKLMKQRGGLLSIAEAGPIILQALKGLEYAHQAEIPKVKLADGSYGWGRGLVHRDLKPQNLFLSGSGSTRITKIGDFRLAKAFDLAGLSGRTRTGATAGTPAFMPRQQVIKFKYVKPDVDVWAAAASLYCMLTSAVPRNFTKGQDPWQVVLDTSAVPIRERDSKIPARLAKVIDLALVDKPQIHFNTAAEFQQALESVL